MSVFISRRGCSGIAIGTSSARAFIRVSVSGIAASSFTPLFLSVVSLLLLYSSVPRLLCCSVEFGSCVLACIELTVWISCYWPTFFFCGTTSGTPTRLLHAASISHLLSVSLSLSPTLSTGCRILLVRLPRQHSMQAENVQTVKCQKAKCECHRELCEGTRSHDHGQVHTRSSGRGC